jgi:hypothetical protein
VYRRKSPIIMNTTERAAKPNLPSAIILAAALIQVFSRRLNSPPDASKSQAQSRISPRRALDFSRPKLIAAVDRLRHLGAE